MGGRRSKAALRCVGCRLHVDGCLCHLIRPLQTATRLVLVMHHREWGKATATGPLALAALPNHELHIHGRVEQPLNLAHVHQPGGQPLLLFPGEGAQELGPELLARLADPVRLIVPDGNWGQARRMAKRIPGLEGVPCVTLPAAGLTRWGVRTEPRVGGLATFEAIARAMGILESPAVQQELEVLFDALVAATLAARGSGRKASAVAPPAVSDGEGAPSGTVAAQLSSATGSQVGASLSDCQRGAGLPLQVLYQDEQLVVVDKPSGMPVHRGWAQDGEPVLQRLRDQVGRHLFPVHRLDRATSGVLVFAFSSSVARSMQELFGQGAVEKRYLALCRGCDPGLRRVDHPLAKVKGGEPQPAVTDFMLLGKADRYGLYEVRPLGGRTHQIRRHLKHALHPIIGDVRYGKGEHNRIFRERYGFHRLALHCHMLAFPHPVTRRSLRFLAEPSGSLADLLRVLRLWPVPQVMD